VGEGTKVFSALGRGLGSSGGGGVYEIQRIIPASADPGGEAAAVKFCNATDSGGLK